MQWFKRFYELNNPALEYDPVSQRAGSRGKQPHRTRDDSEGQGSSSSHALLPLIPVLLPYHSTSYRLAPGGARATDVLKSTPSKTRTTLPLQSSAKKQTRNRSLDDKENANKAAEPVRSAASARNDAAKKSSSYGRNNAESKTIAAAPGK